VGIVGGQVRTLRNIEFYLAHPPNDVIDPRYRSCISCTAASCPDLRASAYTPENLNEQMSEQMRLFLAGKGLSVDTYVTSPPVQCEYIYILLFLRKTNEVKVGQIFRTAEDWTANGTEVMDWLITYAPNETSTWLRYDSLHGQTNTSLMTSE